MKPILGQKLAVACSLRSAISSKAPHCCLAFAGNVGGALASPLDGAKDNSLLKSQGSILQLAQAVIVLRPLQEIAPRLPQRDSGKTTAQLLSSRYSFASHVPVSAFHTPPAF
jgi:hypothetical protein